MTKAELLAKYKEKSIANMKATSACMKKKPMSGLGVLVKEYDLLKEFNKALLELDG